MDTTDDHGGLDHYDAIQEVIRIVGEDRLPDDVLRALIADFGS